MQRIVGDVDLSALVRVLADPSEAAMDRRQCSVHLAGQDSFHSAAGPVDLFALVRVLAGPSDAAGGPRQCSVFLAGPDYAHRSSLSWNFLSHWKFILQNHIHQYSNYLQGISVK